jgi:hypothetical protein
MCAVQLELDEVFISKEEIAKDVKEQVCIYHAQQSNTYSSTLVGCHQALDKCQPVSETFVPSFQGCFVGTLCRVVSMQ